MNRCESSGFSDVDIGHPAVPKTLFLEVLRDARHQGLALHMEVPVGGYVLTLFEQVKEDLRRPFKSMLFLCLIGPY